VVTIPGSFPVRVVADRYGNLWFTEPGANRIGEFTIGTGVFHEHQIPTPNANPFELTTYWGNLSQADTHLL
jgi:hypothetical protein